MEFISNLATQRDHYWEWDLGQFQILGCSVAGIETVLAIPQWNLCFETGRAPDFAFPRHVLALSHWHLDHAGGLPFYLGLRHLNSLENLQIVMPADKIEEAHEFLKQLRHISESKLSYQLCSGREAVKLKRDFYLTALPSDHCVSSQGYLVTQQRRPLKAEFVGKPADEIVTAKQAGIHVQDEKTVPLLAFSGDTRAGFLSTVAVQAQYLLMECSFFGDTDHLQKIHDYGHCHVMDWQPYAERIESEIVVMIHTSQRYSKSDIENSCKKYLPKSLLDRLVVFR